MPWIMENSEMHWIDETVTREPDNREEEEEERETCAACRGYCRVSTMTRGVIYDRWQSQSRDWICEDCLRTCHNCDGSFACMSYWTHDDCPSCYEEPEPEPDEDDGFYYPSIRFFGQGPKFFGLEIETEVKSDVSRPNKLRELRELLGNYAALKDDGSLDYGIEIATQPASMSEHKTRLAKLFANLPRGLRSWRQSSCGLHIHVSRSPLSDLAIAKTVCFVSANHNRRFIRLLAGRDSNSYCKILPKKMSNAAKYNDDRYEAINLQNERTIEFRLFKGTLRQASVFKALEFTDALTTYAGKAARSIRDSQSRVQFCGFVEENAGTWPNLCAFIQARWYGRETELTKSVGFDATENNQENLDQTEEQ